MCGVCNEGEPAPVSCIFKCCDPTGRNAWDTDDELMRDNMIAENQKVGSAETGEV